VLNPFPPVAKAVLITSFNHALKSVVTKILEKWALALERGLMNKSYKVFKNLIALIYFIANAF